MNITPALVRLFINFAFFQAGWFACVLLGNAYGIALVMVALTVHHLWVMREHSEWYRLIIIAALGLAWDTSLAYFGILVFSTQDLLGIPFWLIALWLLFASTFEHSLKWLAQHKWLAAALACVFGPVTYVAGLALSGGHLNEPVWVSLSILAIGWAILFPVGLWIGQNRFPQQTKPTCKLAKN